MVAPRDMIPGQPEAVPIYRRIQGDATLDADVRDTCLWALVSIGRAKWDQQHQHLDSADAGIPNFDAAVNCWSMVVKWAVMSGALPKQKKSRFLAKLNSPKRDITLANAEDHVPGGFSLIRELVGFLKELGREEYAGIEWVVGEILVIVNTMDVDAIRDDPRFAQVAATMKLDPATMAKPSKGT